MRLPSRTAQAVAVVRADLTRPHTPGGDPHAQRRLCAGMRPARLERLRPHLVARTRFFDERVLDAIAHGVGQIVVVGAGYDDRALRFRSPGVRFYEVDHPDTQVDKRSQLASIGAVAAELSLVPTDLEEGSLEAALAAAGHDPRRPSLFLCEGLLVYLDERTIHRVLGGLADAADPGSTLAASLAIHPDGLSSWEVVAAANATRRWSAVEPWRTILPTGAHIDLLRRSGWAVVEAVDDSALEAAAPAGRSLLVAARPGPRNTPNT